MVCGIHSTCGQGEGRLQLVFCCSIRDEIEGLGLGTRERREGL